MTRTTSWPNLITCVHKTLPPPPSTILKKKNKISIIILLFHSLMSLLIFLPSLFFITSFPVIHTAFFFHYFALPHADFHLQYVFLLLFFSCLFYNMEECRHTYTRQTKYLILFVLFHCFISCTQIFTSKDDEMIAGVKGLK